MRLYEISHADVASAIWHPTSREIDERGNARLTGSDRKGCAIIVVVAADDPGFVITTFQVHPRAVVALRDGRPIELQVLYPDAGVNEPLEAAAQSYGLDREALSAAIQAALAAPDRTVTLDVAVRSVA